MRSSSEAEWGDRRPGPKGVRLGRFLGVEVAADFSLFVIFALVALSLGSGMLRVWHPDWSPGLRWTVAFGAAVLFFASVLVHEMAHALVARAQRMPVRGITLFMFGGFTQIGAEPESPGAEFLLAIVGPLTSLAIGFAASWLGTALSGTSADALARPSATGFVPEESLRALGPLPTLLLWLGPINLVLGVFNLVPGFPLDGGRVLRAVLWWITGSMTRATRWAAAMGELVAWLLISVGVLMAFGLRVPVFGGGLFQGMWFILIGWFLASSARAGLARVLANRALAGVPVHRLMTAQFEAVDPRMTVGRLVSDHLMRSDQRCFPVVASGHFLGLVTLADVRSRLASTWDQVEVERIMTPADAIASVSPDDDAARALEELVRRDVEQVPVLERGTLVGLLRRRDLVQWMALSEGASRRRERFRGAVEQLSSPLHRERLRDASR
jgi:Zn-dependent protease/predicted transcriptional regulator